MLRLLASKAGGVGSIPGAGSRIPHIAWRGQKVSKKRVRNSNVSLENIMYFEDTMLSETSSKIKIKTVLFHSYEVSRVVKSIQKAEWWLPGDARGGDGKLVFNRNGGSVL